MATSLPKTMRAIAQNPPGHHAKMEASVQQIPVPTLGENDVLIKIHYVAQVSSIDRLRLPADTNPLESDGLETLDQVIASHGVVG